ncbi:MAG: zinc-ribbon domain-containing protein [Pseudomonadota bacterium]|nr:zinc-ribbon domain-containing protein [Pseudomonadota bacterium]
MILTCNSCGKKFVVPDSAITASGRMVQCGSCGNKWKQFPVGEIIKTPSISRPQRVVSKSQPAQQKIQRTKKLKKTTPKKPREISLYSPEYLAKKHGIKINDTKSEKKISKQEKGKINFGFYNSLIVFIFFVIVLSRILYFSQGFIVLNIPQSEYYLSYFFESIRNIFEIWKNLITIY